MSTFGFKNVPWIRRRRGKETGESERGGGGGGGGADRQIETIQSQGKMT